MQAKVAIIGGGIVGSLTAYFLKEAGFEDITIFDREVGQATSASAGIISPWLSKRRNQKWYHLANEGAALYPKIVANANISTTAYRQTGTVVTRANSSNIDELVTLANNRKINAPMMQEVKSISAVEIMQLMPQIKVTSPGVFISGGARIDGAKFIAEIKDFINIQSINQSIELTAQGTIKDYPEFDIIILAVGAWLPELLAPLNYKVNVRPQKGQLIELAVPNFANDEQQPVLMPEGESDFIPQGKGKLIIGASHENQAGFDLTPTHEIREYLLKSAQKFNPELNDQQINNVRVGTRAYTPDFAPFFGYLPEHQHIYVASGLGSSGLTTGPMIAKLLAELIINNNELNISAYTKSVSEYIKVAD